MQKASWYFKKNNFDLLKQTLNKQNTNILSLYENLY